MVYIAVFNSLCNLWQKPDLLHSYMFKEIYIWRLFCTTIWYVMVVLLFLNYPESESDTAKKSIIYVKRCRASKMKYSSNRKFIIDATNARSSIQEFIFTISRNILT